MLKQILLLFFTFSTLFAYDFSKCREVVGKSLYPIDKSYGVAIKPDQLLYFSHTRPPMQFEIKKFDPFLDLYLLKSPKKMTPMEIWAKISVGEKKPMASLLSRHESPGKITMLQQGIDGFAKFSSSTKPNSVISSICYHMHGLGIGDNGFIDAIMIKRFLSSSRVYYGDIGVRVEQTKEGVRVEHVDPFVKDNPFIRGDIILSIDGRKTSNFRAFQNVVMDLKEGRNIKVRILREGRSILKMAYVDRRYGGGFLKDTFLEKLGLVMDEKLVVRSVDPTVRKEFQWLKAGDQLIEIDRKPMYNLRDLKNAFTLSRDRHIYLLFVREDFQFFVRLKSEKEI